MTNPTHGPDDFSVTVPLADSEARRLITALAHNLSMIEFGIAGGAGAAEIHSRSTESRRPPGDATALHEFKGAMGHLRSVVRSTNNRVRRLSDPAPRKSPEERKATADAAKRVRQEQRDARKVHLPIYLSKLLGKPNLLPGYCVACGSTGPLNEHHAVAGRRDDPTNPLIHLCGSGTTICHGDIKKRLLHLDWRDGAWWKLRTAEPTSDFAALDMDGWEPCHGQEAS